MANDDVPESAAEPAAPAGLPDIADPTKDRAQMLAMVGELVMKNTALLAALQDAHVEIVRLRAENDELRGSALKGKGGEK